MKPMTFFLTLSLKPSPESLGESLWTPRVLSVDSGLRTSVLEGSWGPARAQEGCL